MSKKVLLVVLTIILVLFVALAFALKFIDNNIEPTVPSTEPTEMMTEVPTEASTEPPTEEPTEEPTEAPTEAPDEEPTEEPEEEPTEEPTEAPTEKPTEAPVKEVTFKEINQTMYIIQDANVRNGPSTSYKKIGGLYYGTAVTCIGKGSNGWYKIEYKGGEGYVAGNLLSDEKPKDAPEETKPAETKPSATEPTVAPHGHQIVGGIKKEATCFETGILLHTCAVEGCTYSEEFIIDKKQHIYSTETFPAVGDTPGYKQYTCQLCKHTYKDTLESTAPEHKHKYTSKDTAPTCIDGGYTTYTCLCGYSYDSQITVPAKGHDYTTQVIAPTTDAQGYTLHTCKNCGDSYKDTYTAKLPASGDAGGSESPQA